jgi:hypothetical protein
MNDVNELKGTAWEDHLVQVFTRIQNEGGMLPFKAYLARMRTYPIVYHEVVTLAPSDDGNDWEMLLDLRPANDPFYANHFGTQGGTVMMGQGLKDLFRRHVEKESLIPFKSQAEFRFCGLATTPWAKRDHAYVPVFARLLARKPEKYQGTWVSVSKRDQATIDISCRVYVEMAVNVMLNGAMPYYAEFTGTYSDMVVPAIGEDFFLTVDNDINPMDIVVNAGCDPSGWKYIGPPLSGQMSYQVKLIKLGFVNDLTEAKSEAAEMGYRLLEGQARDAFRIQYPVYDGNGGVIFGGSEWEFPDDDRRVTALAHTGNEWAPVFCWSTKDFDETDRWAVTDLEEE